MDKRHVFIVIGLCAAAAVWWHFGHPGWLTAEQKRAQVMQQKAAREAAEPKLYKWRNSNGELQLTDSPPPKGIPFERVDVDSFQNTVDGDRP
jgi:hypothetical protein